MTRSGGHAAVAEEAERTNTGRAWIAVHGHFYQPAREDPFSGVVPRDEAAAPAHDWNERIVDEAYAPNAELGNFRRMGWDLGPTLATWLRRERPLVHDAIVAQDDGRNAMAQGYHHAILPLASARDRRTEIRWALRDVELRTGRRPTGLWLPETAVDRLTLRICAEEGVRWTILAPWQAEGPVDHRLPYRVPLGDGLSMLIAFYDAELSARVSFDPAATADADHFAQRLVAPPLADGGMALIATDGELYGHHQPFRELFLERLLEAAAPASGVEVVSPGAWLETSAWSSASTVAIRERTSWSCHHGITRWAGGCACAADGQWKTPLRAAFERLAGAIDAVTMAEMAQLGVDGWAARDAFADVVSGYAEAVPWARARLRAGGQPGRKSDARLLATLLRAQGSRLAMFASDGWYWEDPRRVETAQVLRFAAHAAQLVDGACGTDLEVRLVDDLAAVRAPLDGPDGASLYVAALEAVGQEPRTARR